MSSNSIYIVVEETFSMEKSSFEIYFVTKKNRSWGWKGSKIG